MTTESSNPNKRKLKIDSDDDDQSTNSSSTIDPPAKKLSLKKNIIDTDEPSSTAPTNNNDDTEMTDAGPTATTTSSANASDYDGSESDDEDDQPLSARLNIKKKSKRDDSDDDEDSDEDVPLAKKIKAKVKVEPVSSSPAPRPSSSKSRKKPVESESDDDDDDDSDDEPLNARLSKKKKSTSSTKVKKEKETPKSKSKSKSSKATKKEKEKEKPSKSKKVKKEPSSSDNVKQEDEDQQQQDGEEDSDEYKWWLDQNRDESIKFQFLEHRGPYFPPPYVPHGVKMKYEGKEVELDPEAEEVAGFYAALLGTDWAENKTFQANFFNDFLEVLKKIGKPTPIKVFEKCDFTPMFEYFQRLKEEKKNMTKEDKDKIKAEKKAIEDEYGWCTLDGRKEKVGNFRIEPPGLFRGRGEHPKTGHLKHRLVPEQITLNLSADAKIPDPPAGHKWGKVTHDNKVSWLAMWKENVNDSFKYIFLAANSSLKGQSDFKKFEKARELKNHAHRIREDYTRELRDKVMATRQRATAMYLIDRLALRAGNEKGEDEADTVGCCSLRYEHISLAPPNKVIFDFLGKDSIRYYNEVEVDEQVFKNLRIFKKDPKKEGDPLFDRLGTSILNKHLNTYMQGLTAKVFRTYNASYTFQNELKKTPEDGSVHEKVLAYNRANRQVAILCNHQRSVPKGHGSAMTKMAEKIKAVKYQRQKVKTQMLESDPKLKKKRPELVEPESDLDDEFIAEYEKLLEEKEKEKDVKRLEKENEKRKEEGKKPITMKDLPSARKSTATPSMDRLEKQYETYSDRIKALKLQQVDKDENKTTALGTSKINYIDPRISVAWCKKHSVPLEKIFTKSLREKFKWAMDVEGEWNF